MLLVLIKSRSRRISTISHRCSTTLLSTATQTHTNLSSLFCVSCVSQTACLEMHTVAIDISAQYTLTRKHMASQCCGCHTRCFTYAWCIKLQWQGADKRQRCSAEASSQTTIHTHTQFTPLRSKWISWRLSRAQCSYVQGPWSSFRANTLHSHNCCLFRLAFFFTAQITFISPLLCLTSWSHFHCLAPDRVLI